MNKLITHIFLFLLCFSLAGCAAYEAAHQSGPVDLTGIGVGTPREVIISRLGVPKIIEMDVKGHKQDTFEFSSGMHQASKVRVFLYLVADVFTLTLAEILLLPLETTLLKSTTYVGIATYDSNFKIQSWIVTDKKDSGQDDSFEDEEDVSSR